MGELGLYILYFAPVRIIRTSRDHGNEMMDESAIQLRLDWELNSGTSGLKPSALTVADTKV